jgi:hypothetical protein
MFVFEANFDCFRMEHLKIARKRDKLVKRALLKLFLHFCYETYLV